MGCPRLTVANPDDFAGQLANQTNLAIKGIVAISAMADVANIVGATSDAANFSTTALEYIQMWEFFAIDPSERHTLLGYQWRSSWGLLYNIFPDKLLDIGIVPQYVYEMQSDWYPTVSQIFGVPLDNRHSYTKSDWEMWTAATCAPSTRRLFVDAIAYWLNYTTTDRPFTDLYETISTGGYPNDDTTGQPILFLARPVQGGLYALLALGKKGQNELSAVGSTNNTGIVGQSSVSGGSTMSSMSSSSFSSMTGPPEPPTNTSWMSVITVNPVTQFSDGQPQANTATG
jgi:hypothetical protein